jgi:heme O synthase-like polyprenyltransferase
VHILWFYWVIALIIDLVFAWICYTIAKSKGRSAGLYAIFGFFFSIITLIVILVLPSKTPAMGAGMQPPPTQS